MFLFFFVLVFLIFFASVASWPLTSCPGGCLKIVQFSLEEVYLSGAGYYDGLQLVHSINFYFYDYHLLLFCWWPLTCLFLLCFYFSLLLPFLTIFESLIRYLSSASNHMPDFILFSLYFCLVRVFGAPSFCCVININNRNSSKGKLFAFWTQYFSRKTK